MLSSTDLAAAFRSEVADAAAPYLWSDDDVARYMDDAQKMFCRLTEGIEDSRTPSVCQINVVPNSEWYNLSPLILKVRYVTRTDTGADVPVYNPETSRNAGIRFSGQTSSLRCLVQGLSKGALRAYPIPNETVLLELGVFRLPLKPLDFRDVDQALEIDEQHHQHLLLWMKHLAYDKQDADTVDRRKSEDFGERFRAYCAKARQEQERARRVIGSVAYGGIEMSNQATTARSYPNDYGRPT